MDPLAPIFDPTLDPIRRYRQRAGLTREVTVARADCSLASLQQLELGARPRKSAVLRRIVAVLASELDLDYGELLVEIEGPRNGEAPAVQAEASQTTDAGGASDVLPA